MTRVVEYLGHEMRLPPATRQDGKPPLAIWPLGLGRWTSSACPWCRHVFRRDFWPNNVRLGSGERICRHCREPFDDGAREWPELTISKKLRFFFPPLLLGVCGGFELAPIVLFFTLPRDEHIGPLVIVSSLIIGAVLVLVWSPLRLIWVLRSTKRYNKELLASRTS